MQLPNNLVVIAAAGSRKTTLIVEEAIQQENSKVLVLTYTIENIRQIKAYFIQKLGSVPRNITIQSWYTFLLSECVRPYQNFIYDKKRIKSIDFMEGRSAKFVKKTDIEKYFFSDSDKIYTDKMSEFTLSCDKKSNGLVIDRLEKIYQHILIDEIQDLAGYDFDLLDVLFKSKIQIMVVGDCRQATYFTNCSPKNKRYKGNNIINLFNDWACNGLCKIQEKNESYRCNQYICEFADKLYPNLSKTISKVFDKTQHDGIFIIGDNQLQDYIKKFSPVVLRYSKKTNTGDLTSINFGISKGQSFDRVLIFPNGPIKAYLKDGNPKKLKQKTKAGFYVAITRARYSVAFVYGGQTCFNEIKKY